MTRTDETHGGRENGRCSETAGIFRFGRFALDPHRAVLTCDGRRVALTPQPLALLTLLVEQPGVTVTRETIRRRLWQEGHVEADLGINRCIRAVRAALRDDARNPIYVETLVGRGYRFLAPVRWETAAPPRRPRRIPALGAAAAIVGGLWLVYGDLPSRRSATSDLPVAVARIDPLLHRRDSREVTTAVELLEQFLAEHPRSAPGHGRLSFAHAVLDFQYQRPGHGVMATEHAQTAMRIDPDHPASLTAMAAIHAHRGAYETALELLDAARARTPHDLLAGLLLGRVYRNQGRWAEAHAILSETLRFHPQSIELVYALTSTSIFLHRFDEASSYVEHMMALDRRHAVPAVLRPIVAIHRNRTLPAPALAPDGIDVGIGTVILSSRWLSRIYADHVVDEPARFAQNHVPIDPVRYHLHLAEALWYAGETGAARGAYAEAARRLEQRITVQGPESVEPVIQLALARAGLQDTTGALHLVEEALHRLPFAESVPDAIMLRHYVAEVLARIGDTTRALDLLEFMAQPASPVSAGLLTHDPVWNALRGRPRFDRLAGASGAENRPTDERR